MVAAAASQGLYRLSAMQPSSAAVVLGGATNGTVTVRDFSPCRTKDIQELNFPDEELLVIYVPLLFSVCAVLTLSL
jgi:hypothetical protein